MIRIPSYTLRRLDDARAGLDKSFPKLEKIVQNSKTLEEACALVKANYGVLPSATQLKKYLEMTGIKFKDLSRN